VTERIIGLELDRLIEVGERAIEIAKGGERAVAIVEQIGVVPYQLDGAVVIVKSPSVVLLGGVGPAAVVVDFGVVGLELDGLVVVVDGKVVFLGLGEGEAAAAIDGRVVGIELERLVEVGNGVLMLVLVLVGDAAVVIGKRDIGLRLVAARDDLASSGDAYVGIAGDAVVPVLRIGQSPGGKGQHGDEADGGDPHNHFSVRTLEGRGDLSLNPARAGGSGFPVVDPGQIKAASGRHRAAS
jgi:hypothetical protein